MALRADVMRFVGTKDIQRANQYASQGTLAQIEPDYYDLIIVVETRSEVTSAIDEWEHSAKQTH